ncbi:MAG: molybdopterin-dependent oxidoreductase, partial [Alphaproteobacteria bacterium]|nr:molybdopterin-dependent oxidoreductase [Alphaproteobacteria bacterium]
MDQAVDDRTIEQGETLKSVVCQSCDGFCPVTAKVVDGRVVKIATRDHPLFKGVLCMKGAYAPKHFSHPDRVLHPLKRVGERGSGEWQRVSWDEAMDDIALRLQKVIDQYGLEAFAVAQSGATGASDGGLCRRFMNHVGSPNWIGGVAYCAGNTAAVNRYVYGWFPRSDIMNSKCILLIGHDPRRHSWTMEYKAIRLAQAGGA